MKKPSSFSMLSGCSSVSVASLMMHSMVSTFHSQDTGVLKLDTVTQVHAVLTVTVCLDDTTWCASCVP